MVDRDWNLFLAPYEQAVAELKVKLRSIRQQYRENNLHTPIEFVTGRVKPVESILTKCQQRKISPFRLHEEMYDIAGLRVMCQFVEDIYEVVKLLHQRNDFRIVDEMDYIKNTKESGYRSYHVVIEYPVQLISGERLIYAEIQIRTLSMNFWATIEHSLNYKYQGEIPEEINDRLQLTAEAAYLLDEEMSKIRSEIQEAQRSFSYRNHYDSEKLTEVSQVFPELKEGKEDSSDENCNRSEPC